MKRFRKNRRGFTLVEIIVTFALTALFMASASLVLSSFMRSHVTASAVAGEQNVAAILVNTVTGELGAARFGGESCFQTLPDGTDPGLSAGDAPDEKPPAKRGQILLGSDGKNSVIWYVSGENGDKVKLFLNEDGYLVWNFYERKEIGSEEYKEPLEWKLGENVYDGCTIESFKVEQLKAARSKPVGSGGEADPGVADPAESETGSPINCLKVTIRLVSSRVDKNHFTLNRSVECRNLKAENIVTMDASPTA